MASPITFGVELEFNLAYAYDDQMAPDPMETREVDMPPVEEALEFSRNFHDLHPNDPVPERFHDSFIAFAKKRGVLCSIRDNLRSIGCSVEIDAAKDPPSVWEVLFDESIHPPHDTPYHWLPMEITSPALPFTPASLDLVARVCTLITTTYVTDTNWSTSVHVHISAGNKTFDFHTMQKLYVFLWAFEPQISTLHPEHRQQSKYCLRLREQSAMVADFGDKWGEPPSILQGIVEFYKCQDLESLLERAFCCFKGKFMAFNSSNALQWSKNPKGFHKPTIECRLLEGTLDGERVVQWVKLLAGLVQSLETIHPESLTDLLKLVQHETWEKTCSDVANGKNQANLGPIPAESTLTIIDILEYLGLKESADYYRNRLFPVSGRDKREQLPVFTWNTDAHVAATPNKSAASREAEEEGMKGLFQSLMLVGAVTEDQEEGMGVNFNPYDRLWSMIYRADGRRHELSNLYRPDDEEL